MIDGNEVVDNTEVGMELNCSEMKDVKVTKNRETVPGMAKQIFFKDK